MDDADEYAEDEFEDHNPAEEPDDPLKADKQGSSAVIHKKR